MPKWREVYLEAILETDWTKMEDRIRAAVLAIHETMLVLAKHADEGAWDEWNSLAGCLTSLDGLRVEAAFWKPAERLSPSETSTRVMASVTCT